MQTKKTKLRKNPIENVNVISKIFFWWVIVFFRKNINRDLEMKDLYEPARCDRSELLGDQLEREWEKELAKQKKSRGSEKEKDHYKPSLLWCLIRLFWRPISFRGLLMTMQWMICLNLQPVLLGRLINYFEPGSSMPKSQAYWYATGIVGIMMVSVVAGSHTQFALQRIGMQIRIACSSLIYRKIMRLSKDSFGQTAGGQIVNLLSNDVRRFDVVPIFIHFFWITPIEMIITTYLVWEDVGIAFFAGLAALILQTIPLQGYIGKVSVQLRAQIAKRTDERIQIMSELISKIQVVKMYSWEKYFERIVSSIRASEMKLISLSSYYRGFYFSIYVFAGQATLFITILTFVLTGKHISPEIVYKISVYCNILQFLTGICFPQAIITSGEALISIRRIEEYLQLDEATVRPIDAQIPKGVTNFGAAITAKKLFATWARDSSPPVLQDLSFEVSHGQLCALVGPIGSGKSSILQLILGELVVTDGNLDVRGKTISYASQEAWLFGGTVRDNILFGLPYHGTKYEKVTKACALDTDFRQLPQGDSSFVGERGTTLSGGQRARIHLARAVYRDADIYLIDDPLSAVDAKVGREIFEKCFAGYLNGKTRILVTHHLQYLEKTDTIIVLKNGTAQRQNTFKNLISTDSNFAQSVDTGHLDDEVESDMILSRRSSTRLSSFKPAIPAALSIEDESTTVIAGEEEIAKGKMPFKVYTRYFQAGGSVRLRCSVLLVTILSQTSFSGIDYWLAIWMNQESANQTLDFTDFTVNASRFYTVESGADNATVHATHVTVNGFYTTRTSLAIYASIILSCMILALTRGILLLKICLNTSRTLHDQIFENLTQATMRFFNTNPTGRILNRFSKDVGGMDEVLPKAFLESITVFAITIGSLVLIIASNYWMVIPTVFMVGICVASTNYYMSIIQGVVRLEGAAKSPMFSHVNYSLEGLLTIRSTGAQQRMTEEFDDSQNRHTSALFMYFATAVVFGFYLYAIMVVFLGIVCYTFVVVDKEAAASANVGLAIAQAIILVGMVQTGLQESVRIVAEMVSAERVIQYTSLPREGPFVSNKMNEPPPSWPQFGAIHMQNLSLKYGDGEPPVLKNINMTISPRQKIGIVGRTGAGKSSLIAALFRLTKFEGSLIIDDINTQTIGLNDLRSRISIIPQEPSLFTTTLRQNLDPLNEFSDDYLWATLDELELKGVFTSLDFEVREGGSNLSLGERQLICLARAVLKNNRIVVLDEATANMDEVTDALIQATVRRKFADCTVLTIAHRLSTVMDNDRILVLHAGQVMEFDHPHKLLQNPRGHLTSMVRGTGPATAERLAQIAQLAYDQQQIMEITEL